MATYELGTPVPSDIGAPIVALHPTLHTLTMTAQAHTLGPSGCLCAERDQTPADHPSVYRSSEHRES